MRSLRPDDFPPGGDGSEFGDDTDALDDPGPWSDEGGGCLAQGLWLTASAPLPPGLLSAAATGGRPGGAGFGQGGVLDELPPGPVLATFTAEAAGGLAGTGVPVPGRRPRPSSAPTPSSTPTPSSAPTSNSTSTYRPGPAPSSTPTPSSTPAYPPGPALGAAPALAPAPPPGPGQTADDLESRLGQLSDDELTGVIRGYRKQASWAQAGELAAVAELAARRRNEALADGVRDGLAADAATDEIAAALTLTGRAAQLLTGRAIEIAGLPLTFAALADGQIDMPKALVLLTGLAGQEPELARTIEAEVIDRAAAQTTGQLRASLNRALLAADPAAAERRRQREEKFARVEQTPEPGGLTAALTGRYLPVTASVAAWNRISDLARQLKTAGVDGHLDELRVQVYLALLTGQALNVAGGAAPGDAHTSKGAQASRDAGKSADSDPVPTAAAPVDDGAPGHAGTSVDAGKSADSDPVPTAAAPVDGGAPGHAGLSVDGELGSTSAATVDGASAVGEPGCTSAGPAVEDRASAINGADGANGTSSGGDGDGVAPPIPPGLGGPGRLAGLGGLERLTGLGGPTRLTGTVNLTVPLATLLGITDAPGELGAFGPVTAHTAREIAAAAVDAQTIRWCVTVTGDDGIPIGHGCARPVRRGRRTRVAVTESGNWAFNVKLRALAATECGHERESPNYRPPSSLWHLIQIRNQRCTHAGCRMPAAKCDADHTLPYEKGGRSCECNLAPLCRHHHRIKQLQGWRLEQPEPGVLAWVTPSGWTYLTGPATYAA